jgi:hypothetical protein
MAGEKKPTPQAGDKRAKRQAAALRANLQRRKLQARARVSAAGEGSESDSPRDNQDQTKR